MPAPRGGGGGAAGAGAGAGRTTARPMMNAEERRGGDGAAPAREFILRRCARPNDLRGALLLVCGFRRLASPAPPVPRFQLLLALDTSRARLAGSQCSSTRVTTRWRARDTRCTSDTHLASSATSDAGSATELPRWTGGMPASTTVPVLASNSTEVELNIKAGTRGSMAL